MNLGAREASDRELGLCAVTPRADVCGFGPVFLFLLKLCCEEVALGPELEGGRWQRRLSRVSPGCENPHLAVKIQGQPQFKSR